MFRLRSTSLAVLAAATLLAGCGGSPGAADDTPVDPSAVGTPDDDGVLRVVGTDTLQWDPPALSAPAGEIVFELQCEERVNHNLVVGDERTLVAECGPGESAQGSLELEPGDHPFVCTIPGHESSMRGTLTVE
ncbi:plastocyanin/azurin family copper-binding protein [Egicoccus sp. AB-alg2]|uniref:plastocyanin/azurin family copper-binding protein n=1 Tax=Egicoccus sp. AB-alg2 TaxID=3242693 RepID=UPI00359CF8A8